MLWHLAVIHLFSLLYSIPKGEYNTVYVPILPLIDISIVSCFLAVLNRFSMNILVDMYVRSELMALRVHRPSMLLRQSTPDYFPKWLYITYFFMDTVFLD